MAEGESKKSSRSSSVSESDNALTPTPSSSSLSATTSASISNTNTSTSSNSSSSSSSSSGGGSNSNVMRIYTKTGDTGTASLYSAERRSKNDECFAALGDIDELSACIGHAADLMKQFPPLVTHEYSVLQNLADIQSRLLDLGSHVATPLSSEKSSAIALRRTAFDSGITASLEQSIDAMEAKLPPLKNFILAGGGVASSSLHIARCVCRRTERSVVALELSHPGDIEPAVLAFLNRLSDWLFVAARLTAAEAGQPEVIYRKAGFKHAEGSSTIVRSPPLIPRSVQNTPSLHIRSLGGPALSPLTTPGISTRSLSQSHASAAAAAAAAGMPSPGVHMRTLFQTPAVHSRSLSSSAVAAAMANNGHNGNGNGVVGPIVPPSPAIVTTPAEATTVANAAKKEMTMTIVYAMLIIGVARYIYTVAPWVISAWKG